MKKTVIALATTATIALGTAGVASAAPQTGLDFAAGTGTAIEKVGYRKACARPQLAPSYWTNNLIPERWRQTIGRNAPGNSPQRGFRVA